MQGNLGPSTPFDLVADLVDAARTGLLSLEQGSICFSICLRAGRIVFVTSNLKKLQLETWISARGLDLPSDLPAGMGSKGLVTELVHRGLGERAHLVDQVREWQGAILAEAMQNGQGRYNFQEGAPVLQDEILLDASASKLLLQACAALPAAQRRQVEVRLGQEVPSASYSAVAAEALPMPAGGDTGAAPEGATATLQTTIGNPAAATATDTRTAVVVADGRGAGDLASGGVVDAPLFRRAASGSPTGPAAANTAADDATSSEVAALRQHFVTAENETFYGLLGLERTSSEGEIRMAYYTLARRFHPDAIKGAAQRLCRAESEEYFASVTEAYNVLTRPGLRLEYDRNLDAGKSEGGQEAMDPDVIARANFEEGRRCVAAGKLHEAMQFFANAAGMDEKKAEYHRELGVVQMLNPRWRKDAEASLRRAVELQPTDARALAHLGEIYRRAGLKQRAAESFHEALAWDPDNAVALEGKASMEEPSKKSGGLLKGLFKRR